ncbi:MAG: hypothetical protein KatS3mg031_1037 [Chitinophagales bacterium]|nr:MAG: hypothetical protein KatS3mg031_1037 [Chitinophagales bacterium]
MKFHVTFKTQFSAIVLVLLLLRYSSANAQPFPPGQYGIYPSLDSIPCIVNDGSFYAETVYVKIPDTISGITIIWVRVDSIVGLPNGINWSAQVPAGNPPSQLFGGEQGSIVIYGNTTDSVGPYPVLIYVTLFTSLAPFPVSGELGALLTLLGGGLSGNILHVCPPCPDIVVSFSVSDVTCHAASDGSISVSVSDGTPPYTFIWSHGDSGAVINDLTAGMYSVIVTDSAGCTDTASVVVQEPSELDITLVSISDVSSCLGNDGSAEVAATGGTGNYFFQWSSGDTGTTAANLSAGIYQITVMDMNGCRDSITATINQTSPISLLLITKSDISSCVASDGSAAVTASGGTPPYSYVWSNGVTDSTNTGLVSGSYTVTVQDASGCTAQLSVVIGSPLPGTISFGFLSQISCFGLNDGSATVIVNGGAPPYSYSWSNGDSDAVADSLAPGIHSVTVTDNLQCTSTASVQITQPQQLLATVDSITAVRCFGESNGFARLLTMGGTPPYHYQWTNGDTAAEASGLSAGTYTVTVTDDNGCIISTQVQIAQPALLTVIIDSLIPVSCHGLSDGALHAIAGGGVPGYQFSWSSGQETDWASGLPAGHYTVTVSDLNGCTVAASETITQPDELIIQAAIVNVSAPGASDGSITLTIHGGSPPYAFTWSTGATSQDITGIFTGIYSVTVTDGQGCTADTSLRVEGPQSCDLSALVGEIAGTSQAGDSSERAYSIYYLPGYSYHWIIENGEILQGQGSGLIYVRWGSDGPGVVKVVVSNGACVDTIELKVYVALNKLNNDDEAIRLHIDPLRRMLLLEAGIAGKIRINVYTVLGRLIFSGSFDGFTRHLINLPTTGYGIYVAEIISGGLVLNRRFSVLEQ